MLLSVCLLGSNLNTCAKTEKNQAIKRYNRHLNLFPKDQTIKKLQLLCYIDTKYCTVPIHDNTVQPFNQMDSMKLVRIVPERCWLLTEHITFFMLLNKNSHNFCCFFVNIVTII